MDIYNPQTEGLGASYCNPSNSTTASSMSSGTNVSPSGGGTITSAKRNSAWPDNTSDKGGVGWVSSKSKRNAAFSKGGSMVNINAKYLKVARGATISANGVYGGGGGSIWIAVGELQGYLHLNATGSYITHGMNTLFFPFPFSDSLSHPFTCLLCNLLIYCTECGGGGSVALRLTTLKGTKYVLPLLSSLFHLLTV